MSEIFCHITESPEKNDVLQSDKNTLKNIKACKNCLKGFFESR